VRFCASLRIYHGRAARAEAMRTALTKPAGPLPPRAPVQVLCADGQAAEVLGELARLLAGAATPTVVESEPIGEAEDVFDAFVGHTAGRRQPEEFPTALDWQTLFTQASEYCRVRPWLRWSDADQLDLVVKIDGAAARYVAVIIGQEGIQRGLVLYPGAVFADGLCDWQPRRSLPLPAGTDRRVSREDVVSWRPIEAPRGPESDGSAAWLYEVRVDNPGRLPVDNVQVDWHFQCLVRRRRAAVLEPATKQLQLVTPVIAGGDQRRWERRLVMNYAAAEAALSATFAEVHFVDIEGSHTNRWPRANQRHG
jgi:hypothetical protein